MSRFIEPIEKIEEGPCEVCNHSVSDCIYPECPECGSVGNPKCYSEHGLKKLMDKITKGDKIISLGYPGIGVVSDTSKDENFAYIQGWGCPTKPIHMKSLVKVYPDGQGGYTQSTDRMIHTQGVRFVEKVDENNASLETTNTENNQ